MQSHPGFLKRGSRGHIAPHKTSLACISYTKPPGWLPNSVILSAGEPAAVAVQAFRQNCHCKMRQESLYLADLPVQRITTQARTLFEAFRLVSLQSLVWESLRFALCQHSVLLGALHYTFRLQ